MRQLPYERVAIRGANCWLSALDFGGKDKPPLVILHGMRDHALSMLSLVEALQGTYRVIAPDLRGHGDSENCGSYAMVQFVADLRAVVNHFALVGPTLIGHSLGGHITSRYAAIYGDEVRALVLIDGMGPPRPPRVLSAEEARQNWRQNVEAALQLSSERRNIASADAAVERLAGNNPRLAAARARLIAEQGVEPHPEGGVRWKWDPAVNMVWSTFDHSESEAQWQHITAPVLVLTGEHSMEYWSGARFDLNDDGSLHEREIRRRVALFRDARHQEIGGAGHMIHYDSPDALNQCISDFLAAT